MIGPAESALRIDVITIFPEYFTPLELSLVGRARRTGLLDIHLHDLRRWTHDVHRTVDDAPYGGGAGMVMRPEPWGEALDTLVSVAEPGAGPVAEPGAGPVAESGAGPVAESGVTRIEAGGARPPARLVVPTPVGQRFTQALAAELAAETRLIFACGRYEGIDQRVLDHAADRMSVTEVSLGDYVIFGGEAAVLVMLEAVIRLIPGVLGNAGSLAEESHAHGLLEAPVYTKPPVWRGQVVPEILRSGDHGRISRWRREQALLRTALRRPDMIADFPAGALNESDITLLHRAGFQITGTDMAE